MGISTLEIDHNPAHNPKTPEVNFRIGLYEERNDVTIIETPNAPNKNAHKK